MKKVFSLIMLSLILILAGCGKNVSDQPEPVIEDEQDDPVIDDEQDEQYVQDERDDPDEQDVSLQVDPVNSMEIIPSTEFNYDEVDTKGLSEETLDLFATCAIYLETGSNTDNGDMLSSKELYEIEEFLIRFIISDNENVEFMHDYNGGADVPTKQ